MALTPNSPNADNSMQALKQYGSYIITAILVALAAYFGWTYWQNNHARVDTVAADQYADIQRLNEEVNLASQNPDLEAEAQASLKQSRGQLDKDIDALVSTHGESIYAWQALMIKARQQVDSDDFTAAAETFKQALAIDLGDAGLEAITRLRYAKTLLAAGDADAALAEANNDMPSSFEASQQELLGDIYLVQENKDSAIKSYNNAWKLLSSRQETRAVLALKMESLGLSPEPIAEQTALIQESAAIEQPLVVDSSESTTNEGAQ
ncbi:tetratricopeptide repeat protein [Psychrobacter sp. NG254]|uniref:YfgM family protein n=1 Tax=Psychrobacter sp. NG254 TaxID=2782003 RepID=UPI0018895AC9|nr:tetratricopeptide repeat protein [Psychrobacter sp. NG254]MBF2718346.1 tetratricopeptide repeat protein [Psychrobacter sp. NG254]